MVFKEVTYFFSLVKVSINFAKDKDKSGAEQGLELFFIFIF